MFFHGIYLSYNVRPLTQSRWVKFQPVPCDGLFTCHNYYFSNYTIRNQTKVHNPGNRKSLYLLQYLNNTDPKCLNSYTWPENIWVIGVYQSTLSPTVLLSIQLFIFNVRFYEKYNVSYLIFWSQSKCVGFSVWKANHSLTDSTVFNSSFHFFLHIMYFSHSLFVNPCTV